MSTTSQPLYLDRQDTADELAISAYQLDQIVATTGLHSCAQRKSCRFTAADLATLRPIVAFMTKHRLTPAVAARIITQVTAEQTAKANGKDT